VNRLGLSLTAGHGLSLTEESAYRKPKQVLTLCNDLIIRPFNYANIRFLRNLSNAKRVLGARDTSKQTDADSIPLPSGIFDNLFKRSTTLAPPHDPLTHVTLTWIENRHQDWIRFGRPVKDQIIDRRRRLQSFTPNSVFAFIRWAANDYGTIHSSVVIVRAVTPGEPYVTLPQIDPGAEVLLRIKGWVNVAQVLQLIDRVEALDIDPCAVAPDYWHHVHHRLITNNVPHSYTLARHRAWLGRKGLRP